MSFHLDCRVTWTMEYYNTAILVYSSRSYALFVSHTVGRAHLYFLFIWKALCILKLRLLQSHWMQESTEEIRKLLSFDSFLTTLTFHRSNDTAVQWHSTSDSSMQSIFYLFHYTAIQHIGFKLSQKYSWTSKEKVTSVTSWRGEKSFFKEENCS